LESPNPSRARRNVMFTAVIAALGVVTAVLLRHARPKRSAEDLLEEAG